MLRWETIKSTHSRFISPGTGKPNELKFEFSVLNITSEDLIFIKPTSRKWTIGKKKIDIRLIFFKFLNNVSVKKVQMKTLTLNFLFVIVRALSAFYFNSFLMLPYKSLTDLMIQLFRKLYLVWHINLRLRIFYFPIAQELSIFCSLFKCIYRFIYRSE